MRSQEIRKLLNRESLEQLFKSNPDFQFDGRTVSYTGGLHRTTCIPLVSMVVNSYNAQGGRCNNPNNPSYPWYGAKGVKRNWDSLGNFVNWYLNQLLKRESWYSPVVSRIGDSGDYCADNCELDEHRKNIQERKLSEAGLYKKSRMVRLTNTVTKEIIEFKSSREASRKLNRNPQVIKRAINQQNGRVYVRGVLFKAEYLT